MKSAVHKFQVQPGLCEIQMPESAEIIEVEGQNGAVCLWAIVRLDDQIIKRKFRTVATGEPFDMPDHWFVGTAHLGTFVCHVFEDQSST